MKKHKWLKFAIVSVLLLLLFTPIPEHWKDGGTTTYSALAYRIVDYRHNPFVYPKEKQKLYVQFFPTNFGPWPEVEYRA